MSPWIDLDDLEPELGQVVLIWPCDDEHPTATYSQYTDAKAFSVNCCGGRAYYVTHWMELPDGPQTEEAQHQADRQQEATP